MTWRSAIFAITVWLALTNSEPHAQQVLPPGQIDGSGNLRLGPVTLGRRQGGVFTLTPDAVTTPSVTLTGSGLAGPIDSGTVGGTAVSALIAARPPISTLPACTPGSTTAPVAAGQPFLCGGMVLIAQ